jgi:hypothetical protein
MSKILDSSRRRNRKRDGMRKKKMEGKERQRNWGRKQREKQKN